jgi:predicted short-subunit dehydrogenase-like oxidoreductase (DUF2520 family)
LTRTNIASKNQIIESLDSYNIVMIGAGNVSTHISRHFLSAGHQISCIYSRSEESAQRLSGELGVPGTSNMEEVPLEADFFILCVPDHTVAEVAEQLRGRKGIWLHTAGALSIDVFQVIAKEFGVLYPLQSLSKDRNIQKGHIPFLVEASSPQVLERISALGHSISERVEEVDSYTRLKVHLAAVFANNFSNHMVHVAEQILKEANMDAGLLDLLLEETFHKLREMEPGSAQTGPAVRGDHETMNKHIELLKDHPEWEKLYTFISRDIERSRE